MKKQVLKTFTLAIGISVVAKVEINAGTSTLNIAPFNP